MASTKTKTITKQAHGRTQVTNTTGGEGSQTLGSQQSSETQVRGAHTITHSTTRGALTQTSTRPLHAGMIVRFRIPLDLMEPVEPDAAELGACV